MDGTDENGNRGIINISQDYQKLNGNFTHSTVSVGGAATSYKGMGYHSDSTPFIFPASTAGKSDLCFTFRYVGDDPEIKAKLKNNGVNTFRFHATEDLTKGALRLVTVVMDIDEFIDAFLNVSTRTKGSVSVIPDPDFGHVLVAPYTLFFD